MEIGAWKPVANYVMFHKTKDKVNTEVLSKPIHYEYSKYGTAPSQMVAPSTDILSLIM